MLLGASESFAMLRVTTLLLKIESKVVHSCPVLCDPLDGSPPGSSVHWIFQARIMKWVAIPFSRGFSRPRYQIQVSCITGGFFTIWATGGAQIITERPILKYVWKTMAYNKKESCAFKTGLLRIFKKVLCWFVMNLKEGNMISIIL